ncbi:type VII secretion protein EccB [Gordonia sp. CPCC 205515]|uniref:type VII secretion protein EccB n=1 Tax=Gordonia sp. CPCC 205515 TaxID=3140791 RepID=UPI003AF3A853
MARQLTTKAQVNGYRFLLRRLEHALVRRDVRMLHDPMRSQVRALVVGAVAALLVLAGFGVWGLIRPQGSVGDARIVMSRNGGGNYVLIDGTLHPVLNLASARLITGSNESPKTVSDATLIRYPRGPLLGIPGAPATLPAAAHEGQSFWTVCDSTDTSPGAADGAVDLTVIGDQPTLGHGADPARDNDGLFVIDGGTAYLIYTVDRHGVRTSVRARVDTDSVPVMRALHLEGATPRTMSSGLLNTFPEVEPIEVPRIDNAGERGPLADDGVLIGSVIKTVGLDDADTFYVVLADGVQRIGAMSAELLRLADRGGDAPVHTVAPGQVAAVPTSSSLPISEFPQRAPDLVDMMRSSTVCRGWSRGDGDAVAATSWLLGHRLPLPEAATPVRMSAADGPGPGVDRVYLRPGSGAYVQATGTETASARAESRYFISDVGVRFGVADADTGTILGLGQTPAMVPWSVISLLTPGPTLSRTAALVAHDGIAPDPDGQVISAPEN